MSNVVAFPGASERDRKNVPAALRDVASRIERGEYDELQGCIVVLGMRDIGDTVEVVVRRLGPRTDALSTIGWLHHALTAATEASQPYMPDDGDFDDAG